MAYGALTCTGRPTLTGILTASGKQFMDWSAAYRLFSHQRIDIERLFDVARENTLIETDNLPMIVAHMDDTIIKKSGKKIPGTSWKRDPLEPPFNTNFIWGQRFLQISMPYCTLPIIDLRKCLIRKCCQVYHSGRNMAM